MWKNLEEEWNTLSTFPSLSLYLYLITIAIISGIIRLEERRAMEGKGIE